VTFEAAQEIANASKNIDFNEADTRFQIIDRILIEVLGWPKSAFRLEHNTNSGFSDYHLLRPNDRVALIVEAKRTGYYFDIPQNFNSKNSARQIQLKALMTSAPLALVIKQAQRYATDEGSEYAAICNGQSLILFKAFDRDRSWTNTAAFVVSDLAWFVDNYTDAINLLGYSSVVEHNSFQRKFQGVAIASSETFFPKEKINSFNQIVNANNLADTLRPIVRRFFGPLDAEDIDIIEKCYVNMRAYDKNLRGIRSLIHDSVSPFMKTYGIAETEDSKTGGAFSKRLVKSVKARPLDRGDVIVLFGGKGSGKSTFIRRVLKHQPPQYIKKHSHLALVDLLGVAKERARIHDYIWQQLVAGLDSTNLLKGDRAGLLELFADRWDTARRQDLFGFDENSEIFNERLNALVATWKDDLRYVAGRLVIWHKTRHRMALVVIDNTDQLDNELQDYSFSIAEEISRDLKCVVLISMREERFYASKMRGMMDAYQNSGFHISSPSSAEVFTKRISYVVDLIGAGRIAVDPSLRYDVVKFFRIFQADFAREPTSPLNRFISACAHGNIRLALDLFSDLILSGYTNSKEMLEIDAYWTILIHQVLKPLMAPTRLFYDEKLSRVPNLFQIRHVEGGSHFTGLRILRALAKGQDSLSPAYVALSEVRSSLASKFGGMEDMRVWMDRLLATNLIEASTRQDYFSEEIDSIRITAFGQFFLEELHKIFTYLDLVSTDCGVRSESACNDLVRLSNDEVQLLNEKKRFARVEKRLEKTEAFLGYLAEQERNELNLFGLTDDDSFVGVMQGCLADEKKSVLRSAKKNA